MAAVNQDLLDVLNANLRSFEAAGPAFEEDVKNIKAKIAKVKGSKPAAAKTVAKTTRKATPKKGKS